MGHYSVMDRLVRERRIVSVMGASVVKSDRVADMVAMMVRMILVHDYTS